MLMEGCVEYDTIRRVHGSSPIFALAAAFCAFASASANAQGAIRTAADLYRAIYSDNATNASFDITATIIMPGKLGHAGTIIRDSTGAAFVYDKVTTDNDSYPKAGTVVHFTGYTRRSNIGLPQAIATTLEVVGRGRVDPPVPATAGQINRGEFELKSVTAEGILLDVFRDEIDLEWIYAIIRGGNGTICGAFPLPQGDPHGMEGMIGSCVTITGIPMRQGYNSRRLLRNLLYMNGPEDIRLKESTADGIFSVPELESENDANLSPIPDRFVRRRTEGRIIATLPRGQALLRTASGRIVRIRFATAETPACGTCVEVSGFPVTDLYRINLSCAMWRRSSGILQDEPPPKPLAGDALLTYHNGRPGFDESRHGSIVSIRGRVLDRPSSKDWMFNLDCNGSTILIDAHELPGEAAKLMPGSLVEVCGVFVVEIPDWHPDLPFPRIGGFSVVTRMPSDIVVLKRPPWWTTGRLATVIASLLMALLAVFAWNRSLQALAVKRGKALAKEEIDRLESDLKSAERTRLSVELHDSIAQTLSGVSMEIGTVLNGSDALPPIARQHLSRASRTLDSCRVELRNCIWDLRSRALDEPDMDRAIRVALGPTIGKTRLHVRFNVPRTRFAENTARTVLNIVRELASNAVRHGHASEIHIAGSLDGGVLRFSVRDNGCGFDPERRPGTADGHFGLQGIGERIAAQDGRLHIASTPGNGTKVVVTFPAMIDEDKERI